MADEKPIENPEKFDPKIVSDEELRASHSGPALLANRVLITKTASGVRLSFMEMQLGKVPSIYRTAVILAYQDAISLRDLLTEQLKEVEDQLKAATAEFASRTAEAAKNG